MDNGMDIIAAACEFLTVSMKDDQCATDQQSLDVLITAYEELVKVIFAVYDFDAKWDATDPTHPDVF